MSDIGNSKKRKVVHKHTSSNVILQFRVVHISGVAGSFSHHHHHHHHHHHDHHHHHHHQHQHQHHHHHHHHHHFIIILSSSYHPIIPSRVPRTIPFSRHSPNKKQFCFCLFFGRDFLKQNCQPFDSLLSRCEVKLFGTEDESCDPSNSTYHEWLSFFATLSKQRLLTQKLAQ